MENKNLLNIKGFTKYILSILLIDEIFYANFFVKCAGDNSNDLQEFQAVIRKNDLQNMCVDSVLREMIKFAQNWIDQNSEEIKIIEGEIIKYTEKYLRKKQKPGEFNIWRLCVTLFKIMKSVRRMQPKGLDKKDIVLQINGKNEVFSMIVKFFKSVKDKTKLTYHPWFKSEKNGKLYLVIFIFDPLKPGEVNINDPACGFIIADGTNKLPKNTSKVIQKNKKIN